MPSKAKTKNAPAHQHDKRHESGLAAPGRRVIRQRSNHNLANGNANGRPAIPATQPNASTTTSTGVDHGYDVLRSAEPSRQASSQNLHGQQKEHVLFEENQDRERTNSDASNHECVEHCEHGVGRGGGEVDMDPSYYNGHHAFAAAQDHALKSRLSTTAFARTRDTFSTISTILSYYPLRDAISILILLLSLPATLILIIQTLFASLTFVPPTASISIPSIKEMFNTSNLGYPALATILFIDLIFYLCWLTMWKPVQSLLLDLSQVVVAVSLSGAAASNEGPRYSIITCSAVICIVHVLRYRAIHLTALDYLRSILHKFDITADLTVFPFSAAAATSTTTWSAPPSSSFSAASFFASNTTLSTTPESWLYTTLRTILGIHIVSQGVTTCIRRSLASANEKGTNVPAIARADTEAAAGLESMRTNLSAATDPGQLHSITAEGRSRASSPGRYRESTSKKRRKQANEVRSKQPLWAAIASTKVTFVKEMEQRDAVDDAKEAIAMDRLDHDLAINTAASLPNKPGSDKVWVSELHDTEAVLRLDLPTLHLAKHGGRSDEEVNVGAGIDKSKPFFTRLNGASWSSAKIFSLDGPHSSHYCVEIFGLAPLSSYLCEIADIMDHTTLCSINVITSSARTAEQVPVVPALVQHQALRPTSPETTLKKAIDQHQASLVETRNRTKKSKKDQKSAYADVRREINLLKVKLDNSGGVDDKQARRLQQITQHKNQAEEATVQFTQQAHEMGEIPQSQLSQAEEVKGQWQAASDTKACAVQAFDAAKAELDRIARELSSEVSGIDSKREKLAARLAQRKEELLGATARQQADMTAKQKHMHERTAKREEQEGVEAQLRFHIASMTNDAEQFNNKAVEAYQQGSALHNNWPTPPPGYSAPATPEAQVSSTTTGHTNGFSVHANPFPGQLPQSAPRGRSSSMLSQYSGFTDNGEDGQAFEPSQHQYSWPSPHKYSYGSAIMDDVKDAAEGSSGSSGTNGSTASSSPRPDGRLFVPGVKMAPIGPPHRKPFIPQSSEFVSPSPPPLLREDGR